MGRGGMGDIIMGMGIAITEARRRGEDDGWLARRLMCEWRKHSDGVELFQRWWHLNEEFCDGVSRGLGRTTSTHMPTNESTWVMTTSLTVALETLLVCSWYDNGLCVGMDGLG